MELNFFELLYVSNLESNSKKLEIKFVVDFQGINCGGIDFLDTDE